MFSLHCWPYVYWLTHRQLYDVWIYVIAASQAKGQGFGAQLIDLYLILALPKWYLYLMRLYNSQNGTWDFWRGSCVYIFHLNDTFGNRCCTSTRKETIWVLTEVKTNVFSWSQTKSLVHMLSQCTVRGVLGEILIGFNVSFYRHKYIPQPRVVCNAPPYVFLYTNTPQQENMYKTIQNTNKDALKVA